ncbi:MAG: hypothetical protein AB1609_12195, partial [Bacillota bacterium]
MSEERCISVVGKGKLHEQTLVLVPGRNLLTARGTFTGRFGPPSTMEEDLLTLAASVYAADIAVLRGEREGFARSVRLAVPVTNTLAFASVRPILEYALCVLSGDDWDLEFRYYSGLPEGSYEAPQDDAGVVLFSGGLDSLAYAVEAAGTGQSLVLVSHDSGNRVTRDSQRALADYVHRLARGSIEHLSFRVGGQNSPD